MTQMPHSTLADILMTADARPLLPEEIVTCRSALSSLLQPHFIHGLNPSQIEIFSEIGQHKKIFSLEDGIGQKTLAIAVPMHKTYGLFREFEKLEKLYLATPEFFPRPGFFHREEGSSLFTMELLPHKMFEELLPNLDIEEEEKFTYNTGFAMGYVHEATGLCSDDPHDGNILGNIQANYEVKLIDVYHFVEGSEEDLIGYALEDSTLCKRSEEEFVLGVHEGKCMYRHESEDL
jgi:hypothetical protein